MSLAVRLTRLEELALITLDRQQVLNALNFALLHDLGAAFGDVAASDARALLITGAGTKAFCAGADIEELTGASVAQQMRGIELGQAVFAKLDRLPIPSVAIVNGFAFGAGLELAAACTFRLALPNAKLGLPEIKLGLIPGYGGTQRLPRLVGEARALDIIMSGRTVDAAEAERIGLVNRLVDGDPVAAGVSFARELTGYSLAALRLAREAVRGALDLPIGEGLRREAELAARAFGTEDSAEGMTAFIARRKPQFRDR